MIAELLDIFNPKEFREHFESALQDAEYANAYPEFFHESDDKNIDLPQAHPVSVFFDVLETRIWGTICPHKRCVDDGWGGPDSGCIDVHCLDCGIGFGRTWLY